MKKIVISIMVVITVLGITGIFIYPRYNKVNFTLKGSINTELNLHDEYQELGYIAEVCNKNNKCRALDNVEIQGNVDSTKIGEYQINYKLTYKDKEYNLQRVIHVTEKIAPEIILEGDEIIYGCPNQSFKEPGYQATDNYDGNLTDKVVVEEIGNIIRYTVRDTSGNEKVVERKFINNDTTKPQIALKGNATIYLEAGHEYQDLGVTVSDNCDKSLDQRIEITGEVNTNQVGSYNLTYKVSDANGNTSSVNRTVKVYDFNTQDKDLYWQSLEYYIELKGYKISLGYYNINKDITYKYKDNTLYYGASLIKTLGALYAYEKLDVDSDTNLKTWVNKAISESDNRSYLNMVKQIGVASLRAYGKSLGAKQVLNRGSNTDYFGNTNVDDQLTYMKYLYNFINSNPKGSELQSYFINDHYNKIKYASSPTVMHKYGYYDIYFHDVGIFLDESPYIIVILSEEAKRVVSNNEPIFIDISEKLAQLNNLVK